MVFYIGGVVRYVPSIPPPVSAVETDDVKHVFNARSVQPVNAPSVPPMVFMHYRHAMVEGAEQPAGTSVQRRSETDRRIQCRRTSGKQNKFLLLDSRAEVERRRNNRRQADLRTSIDEEV